MLLTLAVRDGPENRKMHLELNGHYKREPVHVKHLKTSMYFAATTRPTWKKAPLCQYFCK